MNAPVAVGEQSNQRKGSNRLKMVKKAPNPIDRHVGSRVRMRRMMLSMSQEKLGDALGTHLPASAEIREGRQPDRRQPVAADLTHPAGSRVLLLRRRAELTAAARRWICRSAIARLRVGFSRHVRRARPDQGIRAHQEREVAASHCRSCRADCERGMNAGDGAAAVRGGNVLPIAAHDLTASADAL